MLLLHVACSSDTRFAADCAVMLSSLMATHSPGRISVHLLHDESLASDDLKALRAIVRGPGGSFEAIPVPAQSVRMLACSDRFPLAVWYRVLLADLLPELRRVLYIDADALVAEPLERLWDTDLAGNLLGAATNPLYASMVARIQSVLGLPDAGSYFNSGVLLIDLEAWRAAAATSAVLSFAEAHPGLAWPDQDALNAVLHEQRLHLHPRWNAMPGIWELPQRYLPYARDEVREAAGAPAIVHFVGPHKPWHYRSRHPYRSEYFRYLAQTPWRARPIEGRSPWQAMLRAIPAVWAYRVEVAVAQGQKSLGSAHGRIRAAARRTA